MKKSSRKSRVAITRKDAKTPRQFVQAADTIDGQSDTPNKSVLLGQKIGAELVASVPGVMFRQYSNRLGPASPASQQWVDAWDQLTEALGRMRHDPAVADALKAIDDAHGTALVESEDVTWYAAFRLAMGLRGGAQ